MKAKILIVDDDEQIRQLLGQMLGKNGYAFEMASGAEEARELLKNKNFELILCDIGLPGESGLDFMRLALPEYPHTAGIMVTGQDDPISSKDSIEIGVYDYITKPAERNRVLFTVANALRRRELEVANRAYRQDLEKMVTERSAHLEKANLRLRQKSAERKRAKEVLKESEQKYRLLVNSIPGIIYKGYKDWSVDFIDNKVEALTGFNKEEFDARTLRWSDIIFKEDVKAATEDIIQALNANGVYIREYRIKTKTGETLWIRDRGQIIRNQKGGIEYFNGIFNDITKQKQTEEKLRQNERYYRSILTHMHENIAVINREYQITDINHSFLTDVGRPREEVIGRCCYEIAHGYNEPCDRHGEDCKLREVFKSGKPSRCRQEHLGADGSKRWVDIILSPLKDEQNCVTHVIEAKHDVTDLIRTKIEVLKHYLELNKRIKELNCFYGISKLVERPNISSDEIFQGVADIIPLSWQYPEITCARIVLENQEHRTQNFKKTVWKQTSNIVVHSRPIGTVEVYYLEEKPEIDEGPFLKEERHLINAIAGRIGLIFKRNRTENALRNSENRLKAILSKIPIGIVIIDVNAHEIVDVNPVAVQMIGVSKEQILGSVCHKFICPAEKGACPITDLGQKIDRSERILLNENGVRLPILKTVSHIMLEGKACLIESFIDLTEIKKLEAQLLQSEKMASIGQLAAGVAHEINNPTGFVSSNLKTLSDYIKDISDLTREYRNLVAALKENTTAGAGRPDISGQVQRITALEDKVDIDFILNDISGLIEESREGTERIKNIVQDLKDFAHPGEDKPKFADINKNLDSTVNVIRNELKYKADVIKDYGDLPAVKCCPQLMNQVFMNLLVNAAQSIENRGEIRIKTRAVNGYAEIKISDTGAGIPKANLSKLFDPFFTTKEVGKGTRLGLNVAYNIIKKHKGTIDVESEVGKGVSDGVKRPIIRRFKNPTQNDSISWNRHL